MLDARLSAFAHRSIEPRELSRDFGNITEYRTDAVGDFLCGGYDRSTLLLDEGGARGFEQLPVSRLETCESLLLQLQQTGLLGECKFARCLVLTQLLLVLVELC